MNLYIMLMGIVVVGTIIGIIVSTRKQDEAWKQLASEIGGEFVKGRPFRTSKVQARIGEAVVTLDTYSIPSGDSSTTYTRLRAPFEKAGGLQFNIRREGLIGKLDKALGAQDIDAGDAEFDHNFIVQGKPVPDVQRLLSSVIIRQLLQGQSSISLGTKGNELRREVMGVIRDLERLRSLFQLFKEVLGQLER